MNLLLGYLNLLLGYLNLLFRQFFIFDTDFGVALFDNRKVLIFHIHVLAHFGIAGSLSQTAHNMIHLTIILKARVVDTQHMRIHGIDSALVENTEHLVETVVDLAMQTRYLHDDAIVCQAVDKRIGQTMRDHITFVVARLVVHVEHRLFDIAHLVTQQVHGHHGISVAVLAHILRVGVMHTQILTKTQSLSL